MPSFYLCAVISFLFPSRHTLSHLIISLALYMVNRSDGFIIVLLHICQKIHCPEALKGPLVSQGKSNSLRQDLQLPSPSDPHSSKTQPSHRHLPNRSLESFARSVYQSPRAKFCAVIHPKCQGWSHPPVQYGYRRGCQPGRQYRR